MIQGLLEVSKTYIPVDVKAFDLVKKTMSAGRDGLIAVHPSRHDGTDGRLLIFHQADLYIGRMGTQHHIRVPGDKECVLHFTRWMIFRKVEG